MYLNMLPGSRQYHTYCQYAQLGISDTEVVHLQVYSLFVNWTTLDLCCLLFGSQY